MMTPRSRKRHIAKHPKEGGVPCEPLPTEAVEACIHQHCSGSCKDGKWGDWSHWSECSASCSGGVASRSREVMEFVGKSEMESKTSAPSADPNFSLDIPGSEEKAPHADFRASLLAQLAVFTTALADSPTTSPQLLRTMKTVARICEVGIGRLQKGDEALADALIKDHALGDSLLNAALALRTEVSRPKLPCGEGLFLALQAASGKAKETLCELLWRGLRHVDIDSDSAKETVKLLDATWGLHLARQLKEVEPQQVLEWGRDMALQRLSLSSHRVVSIESVQVTWGPVSFAARADFSAFALELGSHKPVEYDGNRALFSAEIPYCFLQSQSSTALHFHCDAAPLAARGLIPEGFAAALRRFAGQRFLLKGSTVRSAGEQASHKQETAGVKAAAQPKVRAKTQAKQRAEAEPKAKSKAKEAKPKAKPTLRVWFVCRNGQVKAKSQAKKEPKERTPGLHKAKTSSPADLEAAQKSSRKRSAQQSLGEDCRAPCKRGAKAAPKAKTSVTGAMVVQDASPCGHPALGPETEEGSCNSDIKCDPTFDCEFNDWADWSQCSTSCSGLKSRSRGIKHYGSGNGGFCEGAVHDLAPCHEHGTDCGGAEPVDCILNAWAEWTTCDAEPGGEGKLESAAAGRRRERERSRKSRRTAARSAMGGSKSSTPVRSRSAPSSVMQWIASGATGAIGATASTAQLNGSGIDISPPTRPAAAKCVSRSPLRKWVTAAMCAATKELAFGRSGATSALALLHAAKAS
eukprot:s4973_g1.t1